MPTPRSLEIDGDQVEFTITSHHQVVGTDGSIPDAQRPHLAATVYRNGRRTWSGFLAEGVSERASIENQFPDGELVRLFRKAQGRA